MIDAVVLNRRAEAEGICSFELGAADGSPLPPFEPGAHVDVQPDEGLVRQYSLCPAPPGRYLIAVLREPASRGGSAAMHALATGQRLRISAPRNLFPLVAGARRSLLFAGGIGITPLLAMAEHLAGQGADFALHYCVRTLARAAFVDRIRAGPIGAHVQVHSSDGPAEQRLDLESVLATPTEGTHVYVCGPAGFMERVLGSARRQGWQEAQLHREYFAAPATVAAGGDQSFDVQLQRSGAVIRVPADRTVVQALAEHGIDLPVSCEQGVCGTCVTRVLEGTPEHRDVFLTDTEKAANDCFTPCCSRARSGRLVLDL